jgi:hypothetical protein
MLIAFDPGRSTGVAYQREPNGPIFTYTIKWEDRFKKLEELLERLPADTKMFVEEYRIFNSTTATSHIDTVLWGPEMISLLRYLAYRKGFTITWLRPAIKSQWPMTRVRERYTLADQLERTEHARDAIKLLCAGLAQEGIVKPENVKE